MALQQGMPHAGYFTGDAVLQGEMARERAAEELSILMAQSERSGREARKVEHRRRLASEHFWAGDNYATRYPERLP